jgi:lysophospholipase L1-like esterase
MNQAKRRSRKNEFLLGILVIAIVLTATGMFLEVGLRLLGYGGAPELHIANARVVDDPILDWRYKPDTESRFGKVVYRYNREGFRGENHRPEKTEGIARVVVIGDSVTEGYGVEWPDVFASVAQAKLGQGYEVISLGMGGLNAPQEVHILEEVGLQYAPDFVVVNFVLNDCDFFSSLKAAAKHVADDQSGIALLGIRINPSIKRLLKSSALLYLVNERIADLWGRLKGEEPHDYYRELWQGKVNREKVTAAFERLNILSLENRFKVIVLVWPLVVNYNDYQFSSIHQWVIGQAITNQFSGIDLLPVFSKHPFRALQVTSEDYVHPNAIGHRLAAIELVKWMVQSHPNSRPVLLAQ